MNNKSKIITLLSILIVLVVMFLIIGYIYFTGLNKSFEEDESGEVNYNNSAISYSVTSFPTAKNDVTFKIETPTIGLSHSPKWILTMDSEIDVEYASEVDKGLATFTGDGFQVAVFTNMGESGGFYKSVSIEDILTDIRLGDEIYKVSTSLENLESNILTKDYKYYFFYSQNFSEKEACGEDNIDGCGDQVITVNYNEFTKFRYSIYCGAENKEKSNTCDEFVKNLSVKANEQQSE